MPFSSHTHSSQLKQLFQLPLQPQEIGCYSSLGNPLNVVNELQTVGSQVHSTERVPTHLRCLQKIRYTPSKCLITRRFGVKSPRQSAAFFASIASMDEGGESGNTSRLAEPRLLTPSSTSLLNNNVVGLKKLVRERHHG